MFDNNSNDIGENNDRFVKRMLAVFVRLCGVQCCNYNTVNKGNKTVFYADHLLY